MDRPDRASTPRLASRAPRGRWWVGRWSLHWSREQMLSVRRLGRAIYRPLPATRLRRTAAGAGLLLRALGVELQESRQHLIANLVRPAVAVGLLPVAPLLLVNLVVEEELAVGR